MAAGLARVYSCYVELALEMLGGKWKAVILAQLKGGPLRYGELRERIGRSLSDKMLTERLADLEEHGMVSRTKQGRRGARSVYRLTARANALGSALQALHDWGEAMAGEVGALVRPERPERPAKAAGR